MSTSAVVCNEVGGGRSKSVERMGRIREQKFNECNRKSEAGNTYTTRNEIGRGGGGQDDAQPICQEPTSR